MNILTAQDFVWAREGLKTIAYRDPGGLLTIGRGHTGKDVSPGLMWSIPKCDQVALDDIAEAAHILALYSPGPWAPGAQEALTDFVFNLGGTNYRDSHLRRYVDAGEWGTVKVALLDWDHMHGVVVPGLYDRRKAEADNIVWQPEYPETLAA